MSLSVVVVEHDQAAREGLVRLLEARGCSVAAATGSWQEGLALIERHAPDVALVGIQGYAAQAQTQGELVDALVGAAGGGTDRDPSARQLPPTADVAGGRRPTGVLSRREAQVLELLSRGMTGEQVAEHLVLSAETVRTHVRNAMGKLQASTRVHAVAIALREGYIDGPQAAPAAEP